MITHPTIITLKLINFGIFLKKNVKKICRIEKKIVPLHS